MTESTLAPPKYIPLRIRYDKLDLRTMAQILELCELAVHSKIVQDLPPNVRQHFREEDTE